MSKKYIGFQSSVKTNKQKQPKYNTKKAQSCQISENHERKENTTLYMYQDKSAG